MTKTPATPPTTSIRGTDDEPPPSFGDIVRAVGYMVPGPVIGNGVKGVPVWIKGWKLTAAAVTEGPGVVSIKRIQGVSTPSMQYTPDSTMLETQQSSAVVPGMLSQSLPPHTPHASGQHTVPITFSTPLRPLEQLDGVKPVS